MGRLLTDPRKAGHKPQCSQCRYHDYDEFSNDDGSYDEFEVCRKGHYLHEGVCSDYEEL